MTDISDDPLLQIPPHEDVGALTQARFGYQWNCAVPFCLDMLKDDGRIVAVVCETHEDYVVFSRQDRPELVSIKHRELTRSPWTVADLLREPLAHLLDRWLRTAQRPSCRFMTNHGLKPGTNDAQGLADACSSKSDEGLRQWAKRVERDLKVDAGTALKFLRCMRFDCQLPGREYIADIFRTHKLRPVLKKLGLRVEADRVAYGRLLAAIAQRSQDQTFSGEALVEAIVAADGSSAEAVIRRRITQRTLDAGTVGACLRDLPTYAARLTDGSLAPPPTRLVQKLEHGGLGPTAVTSAKRLRASWYDYESRWRGLPGGSAEFTDLRVRVQALAAQIESRLSQQSSYGPAMHDALAGELRAGALGDRTPYDLDPEALLGLAFELTDECEVWWSPPFPLE